MESGCVLQHHIIVVVVVRPPERPVSGVVATQQSKQARTRAQHEGRRLRDSLTRQTSLARAGSFAQIHHLHIVFVGVVVANADVPGDM
jgi:hypothetical protein